MANTFARIINERKQGLKVCEVNKLPDFASHRFCKSDDSTNAVIIQLKFAKEHKEIKNFETKISRYV